MPRPVRVCSLLVLAFLLVTTTAVAAPRADVAALQVALRAEGLYAGSVDGVRGPGTKAAVRRLQRNARIAVDGVAGPRTRRLLGRRGRPAWGSRTIAVGRRGWDVAALQFKLARHGFPSGRVDGGMGPRTVAAVRRFQARAGLGVDGVAGPGVRRALRGAPPRSPVVLRRPIRVSLSGRYGPRGDRWHAGVDYAAQTGTAVVSPGRGRVATTSFQPGGWGRYVVIDHGSGVRSLLAHLSSAAVAPGQAVVAGQLVGRVGATGAATGPHLHFEVISRTANVAPASALR